MLCKALKIQLDFHLNVYVRYVIRVGMYCGKMKMPHPDCWKNLLNEKKV